MADRIRLLSDPLRRALPKGKLEETEALLAYVTGELLKAGFELGDSISREALECAIDKVESDSFCAGELRYLRSAR